MIEVKELVKEYPGKIAADHVSFAIGQGEIVGLLGANGAGKSTIMNMITGYTAMTSGTVEIDGLSILDDKKQAAGKIGYLPEMPPLYKDMTVDEYLRFVCRLKKIKTDSEREIQRVCSALNITDVRKRIIKHLSKGYKQRVGFAQAMIGDPAILVLDEPTSGLDPKQILDIRKVISSLGKKHTVILSSHILSEVQAVCDRILVMDHGRLVADIKADELSKDAANNERIRLLATGNENNIKNTLSSINAVKHIERVKTKDEGAAAFALVIEGGMSARGNITKTLAEKGLYVVEMQKESVDLEEMFLKLTSSKNEKQGVKK